MKKSKKTTYDQSNYDWVKKQISYNVPDGISRSQLEELSSKESQKPGIGLRYEKPPGRDKIKQIINDGKGVDWTYHKSKGGRGKPSKILPIKQDPYVLMEKMVSMLAFSETTTSLRDLYKRRDTKFSQSDYFRFVKIRNELLSYPMKVYYGKIERGLNKDVMFRSIVSSVKAQLDIIKKIEKTQTQTDKNFQEIIINIDRLNDSNINQVIVKIGDKEDKSYKAPTNTLRRLLKGKKP